MQIDRMYDIRFDKETNRKEQTLNLNFTDTR